MAARTEANVDFSRTTKILTMNKQLSYVVVTPARDEAKYISLTIGSLTAQTIRPSCWIIVNDGSTDETGRIAEEAARSHAWITVVNRPDRGFRKAGGGVVDAFYEGYRYAKHDHWAYVVKLDGDLSFAPDYFEKCFQHFDDDERLGIAGGTICRSIGGILEVESKRDPKFHVRGATKIYRKQCWEDIGGLIRAPGWDTMDEVKANMLGWVTLTFSDVAAIHHRPTGAAYGTWNDRVKSGLACYVAGYHPLFMLIKCALRMAERPYVIGGSGLLFGFLKGYMKRVRQIDDKELIRYFQRQQMNRLLFQKSLWG
jgi:poly-beta-1,6-N-acetyl-D-glucosamine synthase